MAKNILLTISILTAFLIVPTLVFGQSVSPSPTVSPIVSPSPSPIVSPGLTPDNPLYFLKNWKEKIQLFFTFGAENKAKQYLHLSEVRLAEYQKMLEKGKTKVAEKVLDKYEKQLDRALQKVQEVKKKGKDVQDILEKVEQSQKRRLEVLQQNLQKVPESARQGIQNAIDNSKIKIERFRERLGVTPVPTPTVSPVPSPNISLPGTPQKTVKAWDVFKSYLDALERKDVNKIDSLAYKTLKLSDYLKQCKKGGSSQEQCWNFISSFSAPVKKLNETDFVKIAEDEKQIIMCTDPMRENPSGYFTCLYFVKPSDGSIKLLQISFSPTFGKDSDGDMLADERETCTGANQYDPKCVKTNPNLKDSDSDGWWDSIEEIAGTNPNNPNSYLYKK